MTEPRGGDGFLPGVRYRSKFRRGGRKSWWLLMTRSRHRAEAFQIEAQAGPGPGIPPAKMSQRVSLNDGEGLLPSLCSDEPRAERTDQRVRQRSTHRVRRFRLRALRRAAGLGKTDIFSA
jgi:hypothetical protein